MLGISPRHKGHDPRPVSTQVPLTQGVVRAGVGIRRLSEDAGLAGTPSSPVSLPGVMHGTEL